MVDKLTGIVPQGGGAGKSVSEIAQSEKSFGEFLSESLQKVNALQVESAAAVEKIASGEDQSIQEAMIAVEKADVAFKLMMEVRQKILDAYRDISQMQV